MHRIKIENSKIHYHIEYRSFRVKSWQLALNNILLIGGVNCMDGDEDSCFLVFVDRALKKYFLNLTHKPTGLLEFQAQFEALFQIKMDAWTKDFYDKQVPIINMAF